MYHRLAFIILLVLMSYPISAAPSNDPVCTRVGVCHDSEGNRLRLTSTERNDNSRHMSLRNLGCSERDLGIEIRIEEINCFQRFFGLTEGPATERQLEALTQAGTSANRQQVLRFLSQRGYTMDGGEPDTNDWVCTGINRCQDSEGNSLRLIPTETSNLRRHMSLRNLGCSERDLGIEIRIEEINCFQRLFGLTEGPASERQLDALKYSGASATKNQVLMFLRQRQYTLDGRDPEAKTVARIDPAVIVAGHPDAARFVHPKMQETYRPVEALVAQTEAPQSVDRVPMYFPEIGHPSPGKRTALHESRFFNIVYDAPLHHYKERRTQRSPWAEARFLRNLVRPVALLLDPADNREDATLGPAWLEELYGDSQHARLFPQPVMAALAAAPPILECAYDQYSAAPQDDRDYLSSLRMVRLAFWTGSVPEAIAPEVLREFGGPGLGMHPLVIIGPPVEVCPENLGLALEVMATQFPGQVHAAKPSQPVDLEEPSATLAERRPDLTYLPRDTARYFIRILEGDARAGNSAGNKIGVYLAFHRAFNSVCRAEMVSDWQEYTFTRESRRLDLRETESIWLGNSDFDEFYLAASSLVPTIIMEYEQDPTKDFGSRDPNESLPEIYAIRVRTDARNQEAFSEILTREGCGSDIADDLRVALSKNLPEMTVRDGESIVTLYFQSNIGARSINITLDTPYDPASMKGARVISGSDAGLFPLGSDYGGRMLSYIALGDFVAARAEQRKSSDEVIRQLRAMKPAGPNPVADFYEWGFRTSANFSPFTQVITSYIIRRVQLLGSCGDQLGQIVRNYVEIETTRNGYGTEIGSRQVGEFSREAVIPVAFRDIVERAADITPGMYSRELVDGAIERLSCQSEMRRNLEANMIAFNSGADPVWINPEVGRAFGSGEERAGTGRSAYIYTGSDAAINIIQDAARNADPRLSLLYELPDDADRSDARLNLLLVDDIPAMVFDTKYMQKPGGFTMGRSVRMIMTCAANGDLEISQFLSSTEANDLDPDLTYHLTYSAYGLDERWPMSARLESEIANRNSFTFAWFRGRMETDEATFAGLRPTSNFTSSVPMPNGKYHLSFGVDGSRVNTTLAPLLDHCRSIEAP